MRIAFLVFLLLFFLLTVFRTKIHRIAGESQIPLPVRQELEALALKALKHSDVPVAAVVTYQGNIIGKGYNTVMHDDEVHGHAEINALDDAMKKTGYEKFMVLDRKELVVYSTFEPCEMCTGTLEHYNIRKVVYMKDKSIFHWWKNGLRSFYYQLSRRKAEGEALQDSLFLLHPDYPGK